jgi:hypothetical protein
VLGECSGVVDDRQAGFVEAGRHRHLRAVFASTAGSYPVEAPSRRPAVEAGMEPPDSVGDISHHTAPDLHGYDARKHTVHASLVRDYLD